MCNKKTVVSGIRATGKLHIGNYLGAIRYFVELSKSDDYECYFFIANLHSLTTGTFIDDLTNNLKDIVMDFLACDINPDKSVIYAQSSIPQTCELAWLLNCLTPVSNLTKMPHFKEKKQNLSALGISANSGLLTYPVLMAADILGVKADLVPVGKDQKTHIELTAEVARRFNNNFGELFPIPQMHEHEIKVPSLSGEGKMGKSDTSGIIYLYDPKDVIFERFRTAVTDTNRKRKTDPGDPNVCNVFSFHNLISSVDEIKWVVKGCTAGSIGCIECKKIAAENVFNLLVPIQEKRKQLEEQGCKITEILNQGGKRAKKIIEETVNQSKEMMGVPSY